MNATSKIDVFSAVTSFLSNAALVGNDMEQARNFAMTHYAPLANGQKERVVAIIEAWKYPYNNPARVDEIVSRKTEELIAEQSLARADALHGAISVAYAIVCQDPRLTREEKQSLKDHLNAKRPPLGEEQVRRRLAKRAETKNANDLYIVAKAIVNEIMNDERQDNVRRSQILTFLEGKLITHLTEMGKSDPKSVAEAMLSEIDAELNPPAAPPRTVFGRNVGTEPKPKAKSERKPQRQPQKHWIRKEPVEAALAKARAEGTDAVRKTCIDYLKLGDQLSPEAKAAVVDEVNRHFVAKYGEEGWALANEWLDQLAGTESAPAQAEPRATDEVPMPQPEPEAPKPQPSPRREKGPRRPPRSDAPVKVESPKLADIEVAPKKETAPDATRPAGVEASVWAKAQEIAEESSGIFEAKDCVDDAKRRLGIPVVTM